MDIAKRNYLLLIVVASFTVCISNLSAQVQIDTIEKLQLIGNDPGYPRNGNYVLTQDIDASATFGWNGGEGFQPIGTYTEPFCGTFDGQGHKITGLHINRPNESNVGIFRYVATHIISHGSSAPEFYVGKVKNLIIENAEITGGTNVGCLAGSILRIGSTNQSGYDERHLIEDIKIVNSKVNGVAFLGGIAGTMSEGILQNCFVKDIFIIGQNTIGGVLGSSSTQIKQCCSTGLVYGDGSQVGGFAGVTTSLSYSTITQCFSTCWTFGKDTVGGLIGSNSSIVSECFSAGLVYGKSNVGGLVGAGDSSKVQVSFFDIDATQQTQTAGGGQLYTDQMLVPDIFQSVRWDYTSVWSQDSGKTRPYLQIFPSTTEELALTIYTENGTVDAQPEPPYNLWSIVKLTPSANDGYRFAGYELYSGTNKSFIVPIETPIVWTMSSSTSLFVKFLPDQSISINNISDLQSIGNNINYPLFWTYTITSDIDAFETYSWNEGKGFAPIGTNVFWFNGTIIGGGYTITNLYINRPDEQGVALFKYLDTTATISNLTFSGARITGGDSTAVLASENFGSIQKIVISDCVANGNSYTGGLVSKNRGSINTCSIIDNSVITSSTDYAGGICADNDAESGIYFSNVNANVSGSSYIGGIAGKNKGYIRKSYSEGEVISSESYVGGLIGVNQGTIYRCYSHSNVFCHEYGGGLVGLNFANVEETYSKGSVTEGATNSGGLIGYNWGNVIRSFWDKDTSNYNSSAGGTGKTTEEMLESATFEAEGWDFEFTWTNDNDTVYPYLFVTTTVPSVYNIPLEEAQDIIISTSLTVGEISYQCSDTVGYGNVVTSDPLPGWEAPLGYSVNLVVSDGPCPPPTKVLSSIDELQLIGNSADYPLDGGYELSQDIDASNTAEWNGRLGFAPIGNQYNPFTGYFDGKGFKIKNLTINRSSTDNIGLFGKISGNAIIKNLILEDVSISGKNNTGGLIGVCEGGAIINISVSGTLLGKGNLGGISGLNQNGNISNCYANVILSNSQNNSNTGGIVGQNQDIVTQCYSEVNMNITNTPFGAGGIVGSNDGNVSYCTSTGTIKASDNCGGIVGSNAWAISKCWANVYLDGQNYLGGLAGKNTGGTITNCFATGTVKASFYSGGLVGYLTGGTIENCYSIGKVSGISGYIGGLIGYQSGGETKNSFWNVITSRMNTSWGGTGKTTTELLNINTYLIAGWDFANVWYVPSKTQSYPQLKDTPLIQFVSIPRLIDLGQEEANNTLTELGLNRGSVSVQCNTAYPAGTVFSQTPEENNIVAESYAVDMKVSSGPCPTNVPAIVGFAVEQAELILANANLLIGNVNYQCSNQYDEGIVFIQSLPAGTQVPEGSSVDITVSLGPCMTIVPYVIGLTQSSAEYQINTAELTVSVVTECNDGVEPGIVFGQEPASGTQIITGSVVTIYLSTGPCSEGIIEGTLEGEGTPLEGEGIMEGEGTPTEGEGAVDGEGVTEGTFEGEGIIEGEGLQEGEGEVITHHSADSNNDGTINLTELLRVIQFFNIRGYHCEEGTEDGYSPGLDGDHSCYPHSSDYNPQDWQINLGELLRLIQIFNIGHYSLCPGNSEDGFCF
ncbi:MAG: PASTA domain-containing protein [Candidatus Hydrogenedens sp.]